MGATTLIMSSVFALLEKDLKKILAYSTMSQIGYMFLAVGSQSYSAAIFHLMTHAFFKALLFLSAGSVIKICHHERNIYNMRGLAKTLPTLYISFLIGGGALSAIPFITSGFYSKEKIIVDSFLAGNFNFTILGILGSFLTVLYTFRMVFVVFHGNLQCKVLPIKKNFCHNIPLIFLGSLSILSGILFKPELSVVFKPLSIAQNHLLSYKSNLEALCIFVVFLGLIYSFFF